jgi:hypothetical protein
MAFSDAEKAQVRLYLGYPDLYRYKNVRLEGVISGNQLSSEAEDLVRVALTNIATVEAKILSRGVGTAGVKRVDEIEFFKSAVYKEMRDWGRMYVTRISIVTGVPVYSDVFSTQGYLGDQYSAGGLGSKYNGNLIPLG